MGFLPVLLAVQTILEDGAALRSACDPSARQLATVNRGDQAEVRFAFNGESGTCFKVAVTSGGQTVEGYLPARVVGRTEDFEQGRRNAGMTGGGSSAGLAGAGPPKVQLQLSDVALGDFGAKVSKMIAQGEAADALRLIEEKLSRQPANASLLKLGIAAAYYADRAKEAVEYWDRIPASERDPGAQSLADRARRELAGDRSARQATGARFILRYDESVIRPEQARDLLSVLDREYARVSEQIGCEAKGRLTAVVQTREDYMRTTGAAEWSGGLFDGKIRVALLEAKPGAETERTLAHEVVHACLAKVGRWPAWLHEGLAQKFSGGGIDPRDRAFVKELARTGGLPPLDKMSQTFAMMSETNARAAYAAAYMAADLLIQHHGAAGLRSLLQDPSTFAHITADIDSKLRQ
ncbi:MAG: hypothetical protein U0Q16_02960 [Bryobacteraceae bacterium]